MDSNLRVLASLALANLKGRQRQPKKTEGTDVDLEKEMLRIALIRKHFENSKKLQSIQKRCRFLKGTLPNLHTTLGCLNYPEYEYTPLEFFMEPDIFNPWKRRFHNKTNKGNEIQPQNGMFGPIQKSFSRPLVFRKHFGCHIQKTN